tara:strand:+ start:304 stop:705 length:402 start_codon:yes stop_codon:yes gene_type:complete
MRVSGPLSFWEFDMADFIIRSEVKLDALTPLERSLKNDLQQVLRLAGLNVEKTSKVLVPVDTGKTRSSIYVDIGNIRNLEVRIGPTTEYAPFLEFGVDSGNRRRKARPFMTTAVEKEGPRLASAVAQIMRRHG